MKTAAIIPTRNRPGDFADCVAAIRPQVDTVIAVAHGHAARGYAHHLADRVLVYDSNVPNISTMWRLGLRVAIDDGAQWVAVLNDDAIVSPNWFGTLRAEAEHAHAAGASGPRTPGSNKIAGYAFILDATSGVMPDERMRWWYSDDAIQRRCESHSWFSIVPGAHVSHRHPNETTRGVLRQISKADWITYKAAYPS